MTRTNPLHGYLNVPLVRLQRKDGGRCVEAPSWRNSKDASERLQRLCSRMIFCAPAMLQMIQLGIAAENCEIHSWAADRRPIRLDTQTQVGTPMSHTHTLSLWCAPKECRSRKQGRVRTALRMGSVVAPNKQLPSDDKRTRKESGKE